MSKSNISTKVREVVFGKSGGRCEYRGCNQLVTEDYLTKKEGKFSAFAHIIADSPDGPRGDKVLSERLKSDISNIMVLCLAHHKLIDVDDVTGHPVERLREMKTEHEDRIRQLTAICSTNKTTIVAMEANIGNRKGIVDKQQAFHAALPRYPAEFFAIDLAHLSISDGKKLSWQTSAAEISTRVSELHHRIVRDSTKHISVFALAPMPLLMWLGRELGDLVGGTAFQRHRDTEDWQWKDPAKRPAEFIVTRPKNLNTDKDVGLVLSISNRVPEDRLDSAPVDASQCFHIEAKNPSVHLVKTPQDVGAFRAIARALITEISNACRWRTRIVVLPAAPNSLCVEFGRLLLPKADPEIIVYDWNSSFGGWVEAITLVRREKRAEADTGDD